MFISSLKLTTTSAVTRISVVSLTGVVDVIWGPEISSVVNSHGLGTRLAAKSFPEISFPSVISNEYVVSPVKLSW